jgi:hypothetical protein
LNCATRHCFGPARFRTRSPQFVNERRRVGNAEWVGLIQIESAVTLDVLVRATERAKSAKPKAVIEALHGAHFEDGWAKAMPGGAVQFDQTGSNTLSVPIMVQWRKKELVTVWPKAVAKASPVWHS